jgi:hypothetical protein
MFKLVEKIILIVGGRGGGGGGGGKQYSEFKLRVPEQQQTAESNFYITHYSFKKITNSFALYCLIT